MAEAKKKMSKKKKTLIIFTSILAFLIIAGTAVAFWQRTNIEAFMMSRKYSSEEILDKMSENDKQLKEEVEKYFPEKIREFTEEEKELIKSGKISEKQLIAKIISEEAQSTATLTENEIMQENYNRITEEQKKIHADVEIAVDNTAVLIPVPLKLIDKQPFATLNPTMGEAESGNTFNSAGKHENSSGNNTSAISGDSNTSSNAAHDASNNGHNSSGNSGNGSYNNNSVSNINNKDTIIIIGRPTVTTNPSSSVTSKPVVTADSIISKYVSQLYVLESKYIGAIEGVVASAKAEAKAQGLSRKDTSKLLAVGAKYTGTINSLEAKCDGEVNSIISNLTNELNAINADTSIVSTIRSAYASEKSLKRAYYMNMIY